MLTEMLTTNFYLKIKKYYAKSMQNRKTNKFSCAKGLLILEGYLSKLCVNLAFKYVNLSCSLLGRIPAYSSGDKEFIDKEAADLKVITIDER